ncbi:hypothetical protein E2C01_044950 [Portunus trituberculatus]|uniref:Uncharacterized protein n=1 Tax=Portunus trituberculatus TaxID=210409 RepID=A0A5B7FUE9_PORTR|nr:hypothetical protein [Portunus trituberculatus]
MDSIAQNEAHIYFGIHLSQAAQTFTAYRTRSGRPVLGAEKDRTELWQTDGPLGHGITTQPGTLGRSCSEQVQVTWFRSHRRARDVRVHLSRVRCESSLYVSIIHFQQRSYKIN